MLYGLSMMGLFFFKNLIEQYFFFSLLMNLLFFLTFNLRMYTHVNWSNRTLWNNYCNRLVIHFNFKIVYFLLWVRRTFLFVSICRGCNLFCLLSFFLFFLFKIFFSYNLSCFFYCQNREY